MQFATPPKLPSVIGCSFWVTFRTWSYIWCLNHLNAHALDSKSVYRWVTQDEGVSCVQIWICDGCTAVFLYQFLPWCSKHTKSTYEVVRWCRRGLHAGTTPFVLGLGPRDENPGSAPDNSSISAGIRTCAGPLSHPFSIHTTCRPLSAFVCGKVHAWFWKKYDRQCGMPGKKATKRDFEN